VRTTIELDDEVFRAFKRRAAERGMSLAHEIEEALRAACGALRGG
jgi:plasmid stability protein